MGNKIDLTGKKFNMLTVLREAGSDKRGGAIWECLCDCGNTCKVAAEHLKSGHTKSCGCIRNRRKDLSGKRFGKLTAIEPTEKSTPKGGIKWRCRCDCGNVREVSVSDLESGHTKSCGCLQKEAVKSDCVDGTKVSTIKSNRKISARNTSGNTGVYLEAKRDKWFAKIGFKNRQYFLGYYDNINDAVKARKLAEERIYGDFLDWYAETYPEMWDKINSYRNETKCIDNGSEVSEMNKIKKQDLLTQQETADRFEIPKKNNWELERRQRRKRDNNMGKKKYKIGEKINGFEVRDVKYVPDKTNAKHKRAMLLCKCPLCGKEKWFYAFSVVSGRQKSCGCLPKNINSTEKAKELRAKSKGAEEYRKDGTFLPALMYENHQHGDMSLPRGVSRAGKRFSATIHFKNTRYYLGRFDTAEEAGEAYLKARKELHGKYISELKEKDPSTYKKYERLVKKAEKREQ